MSDTNTPENTNVPTPAKKRAPKAERLTVSQIAAKRASAKGIDTSRAAKEVRSRLRANFKRVCELDAGVSKVKTAANDGNRWPALNAKVIDELKLVK